MATQQKSLDFVLLRDYLEVCAETDRYDSVLACYGQTDH